MGGCGEAHWLRQGRPFPPAQCVPPLHAAVPSRLSACLIAGAPSIRMENIGNILALHRARKGWKYSFPVEEKAVSTRYLQQFD